MLEGRRAFTGPTAADAISATLKDAPSEVSSTLARPVPAALQLVVRRCLEKEPAARFQSAHDLEFVLRSVTSVAPSQAAMSAANQSPASRPRTGAWWRWAMAIAAVTLALAGLLSVVAPPGRRDERLARPTEFLLPPPNDLSFAPMPLPGLAPTAPQVGVSPDGRSIALVTSAPDGHRHLWIRELDAALPRMVADTDGVSSWPFWSPDSRSVVVANDGALQKIDLADGA